MPVAPAGGPLESLEVSADVKRSLGEFVEAACRAFGPELVSVVLYGSAAEGRMRATSDVNLVLVLESFQQAQADALRQPLRTAQAAIGLRAMFLLRSEIAAASEAFAQKLADIRRRRRVLYGEDVFAGLAIPRAAEILDLRQQLLNVTLRMRGFYVLRSLREEQAVRVIADVAGPLRSCAAALLDMEGHPADSPRQALEHFASSLEGPGWADLPARISEAREKGRLSPGSALEVLYRLIELAARLRERAAAVS
jgi:predicted nucleotidyltransferase